jgi:hypothetical protein
VQFYFLAPHVYPCVTEDHVVLLDLRRDKYVGIGRDHMATLARCVKGWPVAGVPAASGGPAEQTASGPPPVRAETEGVLARMLAAGMLTTDPARGKEATPVQVPRAEDPLVEEDLEQRPEVTFIDVCR